MPARGTRGQHTSSVGDVVVVHNVGIHECHSIELRRPVVTAAGAAATDEPTQHNVFFAMRRRG